MILAEFLALAIEKLKKAGVGNPSLDARLLIGHALTLDRAALLSQSQRVLDESEISAIDALLARRAKHESVARIIGSREFWGLAFGLNEATLEPRPDSETLIEAVLKSGKKNARILDLGTGTGCLLLSLLHEMPDATGLGIDLAPRAVEQATKNAKTLDLDTRAEFIVSNWLDEIREQAVQQSSPAPRPRGAGESVGTNGSPKFDIIVSNPPYIPASDIPALMQEVRNYDPALALDGGDDGLAPYRLLIPQLANFLNPQGIVAFEVGQGQAQQVADLFQANGFGNIATHKDLGGVERCITAIS